MAKKKDKAITINRNRYNDIRKMDHNTMEECMNGYYDQGFAAGFQAAGDSFNMTLAMEGISQIKGIGEAKLEQIHRTLMAAGGQDA